MDLSSRAVGWGGEGRLLLWGNTVKQKPYLLFPECGELLWEGVSLGREDPSRRVPGEGTAHREGESVSGSVRGKLWVTDSLAKCRLL